MSQHEMDVLEAFLQMISEEDYEEADTSQFNESIRDYEEAYQF